MRILEIVQNKPTNMLPEKYKQMSVEELETRVRKIKDKMGKNYLSLVTTIKKMKLFNLRMQQEIRCNLHKWLPGTRKLNLLLFVEYILWQRLRIY